MSRNKKAIENIDNNYIDFEDIHELLWVTIDSSWHLKTITNKLCKKASQKQNALARISSYMVFDKRKIIMKAVITSQLSY